jgi:DNA-directed RNA polymerase alpha subunit
MKINVEFYSLAEVAAFSKFASAAGLVPPVKAQESEEGWKWKYERTEENLQRALKRISMIDPKGITANFDTPPPAPVKPETPIEELDLPVRAEKCLKAEQILTIEALCKQTPHELMKVPNLGRKSLNDIIFALAERNLKLKTPKSLFKGRK